MHLGLKNILRGVYHKVSGPRPVDNVEECVHTVFKNILHDIDCKVSGLNPVDLQKEFEKIPLDIFGNIQIDRPHEYPNILRCLPMMAPADVQILWTGRAGHILMTQSLAFIKTIVCTYHSIAYKPLSESNVLDFGCGWGRLIRLLYKYVPTDRIYGVDPWDESIEICKETNVKANLYLSDYIPRDLPTPKNMKFDFIIAFSVFTHLSEKVTKICINTLKDYLTDDGVIAITIRPIEYWEYALKNNSKLASKVNIADMLEDHLSKGLAFVPQNRDKIEGEVTYGETTMSIEFIKNNFDGLDVVCVEYNKSDPMQLIIFLKKVYRDLPRS